MNFITDFENTLRALIIEIIGAFDDSPYKVSPERIEKWKEKREIENKKYKGLSTENRLIYYSDFYDLETIIFKKNWEKFSPVFHEKKRFEVFFHEVEKFRNTLSHGRSLISSKEKLLEGISADLRNTITVYHNKNQNMDDYFIRITKVSDSLGNIWESSVSNPLLGKQPVLRVGDDYELTVEANDPKYRNILYQINCLGHGVITSTRNSNRLYFKVTENLVGQSKLFNVSVSTPESDYHNERTVSSKVCK